MFRNPSGFSKIWITAAVALTAVIAAAPVCAAQENGEAAAAATSMAAVPLIARQVLFGNPDKAMARISPDGKRLAYLAPVDGVLNVWVGPVDDPDAAEPVTEDKKRGIRMYFWAYTNDHILYIQDSDGDENWHVYAVDLETMKTQDLTPLEGVRAEIENVSHRTPETILVGLNDRDPQFHDIYSVNILTGERELVQENPGFAGFLTDDDYKIRFALRMTETGGQEYLEPVGEDEWRSFMLISQEDSLTTGMSGFNKDGDVAYLIDSRYRDTGAVFKLDLKTGEKLYVAGDERADVDDMMLHPTENTIQAAAFTYERKHWDFLDEEVEEDIKHLRAVDEGDIEVTSRTLDDSEWIVAYLQSDGPVRYYHYTRDSKEAAFLFTNRSDLQGLPLVKMHPVIIEARDGLKLVSYLSLPKWSTQEDELRPEQPLPMVLYVHGGPWARSSWGYDSAHQWFANRGYAVLDVNFRGSTGFGKSFINAANMEWAGKMHDDLIDAVKWAVDEGIADPDKVCIYGGSYGGYSTLVGLTFTPEVFACGVDIVGPSSLVTLLESIPPYWEPMINLFKSRVGDHETPEGREFLESRSPLFRVEAIEDPLLIGQGANDPRVKQAESDQIVEAMEEKDIPVTYVLFPDEGHGFARPENRMAFNAVAEAFLAEQLGGRYEPIGDDFQGSTIAVPAGAVHVPQLQSALAKQTPQTDE